MARARCAARVRPRRRTARGPGRHGRPARPRGRSARSALRSQPTASDDRCSNRLLLRFDGFVHNAATGALEIARARDGVDRADPCATRHRSRPADRPTRDGADAR